MKIIYTTETFDDWFVALRDKQAIRRIQARIDRAEDGILVIANQSAKGFLRCGFTMGRATACISRSVAWRL